MTYAETLRHCLLKCSLIFPNRLTVDDHLFLVIGNGYEWKNGELVSMCLSEENNNISTVDDVIDYIITDELTDENAIFDMRCRCLDECEDKEQVADEVRSMFKSIKDNILYQVNLVRNIDKRIDDYNSPTHSSCSDMYSQYNRMYEVTKDDWSLYGLFNSSAILNLPDDIKPDWLEAAEKFFNFMLSHKDLIDGGTPQKEEHLREISSRINALNHNK